MSRYTPGPDVAPDEELHDSHGNRIDETYVDQAVTDVHRVVGRPSLSEQGGRTPVISFRLPADERATAEYLAEQEGITLSELARRALEDRLSRAS